MLRDVRREIGTEDSRFSFENFDCSQIPFGDNEFDLIIANHVLFYCDDLDKVLSEIYRVLKPDGQFICSTYGSKHMYEIDKLVKSFDSKITLSNNKLYENLV